MMNRGIRNTFLLFGLCVATFLPAIGETSKRPFTPEDLLRLEELGRPTFQTMVFSPDAKAVAFVRKRPALSSASFGFQLGGYNRADVWVFNTKDGKLQNISQGGTDDSGFWWPTWSPDGQHLAMLSTRGGNIRVWLWDRQSGKLIMLSERAISGWYLQWLSNEELAFAVLPIGAKSTNLELDRRIAELTGRAWSTAWKGNQPTSSVLESGTDASVPGHVQEQLLVINIVSGKEKIIAAGLGFIDLRLSPDRHSLAYLRQVGVWRPDPNKIPETHYFHKLYQAEVATVGGDFRTIAMSGVKDVFTGRLGWSPDSKELAIVGYAAHDISKEAQVFRCDTSEAVCRPASAKLSITQSYAANRVTRIGVAGRGFLWYGKHELLVYEGLKGAMPGPNGRQLKWWAVNEAGEAREFLPDPGMAATQMFAKSNEAGLIALVNGNIWAIDSNGHLSQNLTVKFGKKITSIEWPDPWETSVESDLIFGVRNGSAAELYSLDLKSNHMALMQKPSPDAELAAYSASSHLGIFVADNQKGTFLWLKNLQCNTDFVLLETNTFLRDVYEGALQKVKYRSLDGEELTAWIILPFGFKPGTRYPVVTWVYLGQMFGDAPPAFLTGINETSPFNLQLLASHGYVVLLPSMPTRGMGVDHDPLLALPNGVMPAVDKLIELGIADPRRIGIMGHSYGGYSTYGLVTMTTRFKAAVAMAGLCDWLSFYGTFDARERYTPFAQEDLFRIQLDEAELGNPPWEDTGRYLRNSPITFVDRVQTPLLIIQGDLDYGPIQQGEEFFTGLYRQNKRARFVRYWGEDHIFESPANIRDMWQQIYAWLDEFLKK